MKPPPLVHQSASPQPRACRFTSALVLACAFASATLPLSSSGQTTYTWTRTNQAAPLWGDTANWQGGAVADSIGAIANFTAIQSGSTRTVNIDSVNRTVGILNLLNQHATATSSQSYTFATTTGQTLTFDNGASNAQLNITNGPETGGGTNTFSIGVRLGSSFDISNNRTLATNSLTFSGPISASSAGLKTISNIGTGTANVTISGAISDGSGTVAVRQASASGTLILSGTNSYTGGTVVDRGKLQIGTDANLGAAGTSVTLEQGTSLVVTDAFNTAGSQRGLIMNGDATVQTTGFVNWYGVVSGDGKLTKTGTNTLSLNNANSTHTGGIQVDQGILRVRGGDGALGATSNSLSFASGTTFRVQHLSSATITAIHADRTATLAAGTVTFDLLTETSWAGRITGDGGLTKNGVAVFTLSGTADYAGNTTVSVGTFALAGNATLASPLISIANGATFDVSARNGGFRLASNQSLDVAGTGLYVGTLGLGSAASADAISLTGNLNLGMNSGLLFDLGASSDLLTLAGNFTALGNVDVQLNFLEGFGVGTYTLMSAALITDPSLFVLNGSSLLAGYHYDLVTSGNTLQLAVSAIPEPSTYALLGGLLALGLVALRRGARA